MRLVNLHITGRKVSVTPGWIFEKTGDFEGCLLIRDSLGMPHYLKTVRTSSKGLNYDKEPFNHMFGGFLQSDGKLIQEKHKSNQSKVLLLVSGEGIVSISSPINPNRIKISPTVKPDGAVSAMIICVAPGDEVELTLKGSDLIRRVFVQNKKGTKDLLVYWRPGFFAKKDLFKKLIGCIFPRRWFNFTP